MGEKGGFQFKRVVLFLHMPIVRRIPRWKIPSCLFASRGSLQDEDG